MWQALNSLKECCLKNNESYLAIPKIGCGLDQLDWNILLSMIKYIFLNCPINIVVYYNFHEEITVNVVHCDVPFVPMWDRSLIRKEQVADPFCIAITESLADSEADQADISYFVDDEGLLYKSGAGPSDQLVVPLTFVKKVLKDFHDLPFCGHKGQVQTLSMIKTRFYWPTMSRDVIRYCRSCHVCNQRKTSPHLKKYPLQSFPEVLEPFERTAMDIVGPLVTSYSGNKYLLTFQDHFTKYVEAIPLRDQKADTIARAFVTKIFARHGAPTQLLTDQGGNFVAALMKEVCRLLGVEKVQTTAYHPESNGLLERSHHVFKDSLSHYIEVSQQDWDEWVPYVLMAYRFNIHTATGYSPHFLLYGRDPVLPIDDIVRPQTIKYDVDQNYVSELIARLNKTFVTVRENLAKARERYTHQYNKKTKISSFELGDLVYLYDPSVKKGLSKKLARPWSGPYRVIEIKGPVTYKIRKLNTRKVVHINRLKPCTGEFDEPSLRETNINELPVIEE